MRAEKGRDLRNTSGRPSGKLGKGLNIGEGSIFRILAWVMGGITADTGAELNCQGTMINFILYMLSLRNSCDIQRYLVHS